MRYLQETTKVYRGTIAFGVATDTLDAAGAVLERRAMPVSEAEVRAATRRFVGEIQQIPPMVSARKVGGRRLHELAREGKEVEREARTVRIDRFDVEAFTPGPYPDAEVVVQCSSGTYIRSLALDVGAALGGPAHLSALRRLRVGSFAIEEAHPLEEIESDPGACVLTPVEAMRGLERGVVDGDSARAVAHGSVFPTPPFVVEGPGPYAVVDESGALLAVYEQRGAGVKPAVVLPPVDADGG
jgi:tRNA pseudouridine55 synthase